MTEPTVPVPSIVEQDLQAKAEAERARAAAAREEYKRYVARPASAVTSVGITVTKLQAELHDANATIYDLRREMIRLQGQITRFDEITYPMYEFTEIRGVPGLLQRADPVRPADPPYMFAHHVQAPWAPAPWVPVTTLPAAAPDSAGVVPVVGAEGPTVTLEPLPFERPRPEIKRVPESEHVEVFTYHIELAWGGRAPYDKLDKARHVSTADDGPSHERAMIACCRRHLTSDFAKAHGATAEVWRPDCSADSREGARRTLHAVHDGTDWTITNTPPESLPAFQVSLATPTEVRQVTKAEDAVSAPSMLEAAHEYIARNQDLFKRAAVAELRVKPWGNSIVMAQTEPRRYLFKDNGRGLALAQPMLDWHVVIFNGGASRTFEVKAMFPDEAAVTALNILTLYTSGAVVIQDGLEFMVEVLPAGNTDPVSPVRLFYRKNGATWEAVQSPNTGSKPGGWHVELMYNYSTSVATNEPMRNARAQDAAHSYLEMVQPQCADGTAVHAMVVPWEHRADMTQRAQRFLYLKIDGTWREHDQALLTSRLMGRGYREGGDPVGEALERGNGLTVIHHLHNRSSITITAYVPGAIVTVIQSQGAMRVLWIEGTNGLAQRLWDARNRYDSKIVVEHDTAVTASMPVPYRVQLPDPIPPVHSMERWIIPNVDGAMEGSIERLVTHLRGNNLMSPAVRALALASFAAKRIAFGPAATKDNQ